ncbi:hypothetical protein STANM309S_00039 [Streptomyces tanashiensis]
MCNCTTVRRVARGTKKIALDPAESSAIVDEDLLGQESVGST